MDVLSQSEIDNLLRKLLNDVSVLPDSPAASSSGTASAAPLDNNQKSGAVYTL